MNPYARSLIAVLREGTCEECTPLCGIRTRELREHEVYSIAVEIVGVLSPGSRPLELPSTENSIATIGAPFALFLPTGKEHLVENEQEARELLSYAHALNAYIQGNHTGFMLHRAEEGGTMNVTDRLRLSKQHAHVMCAIYAWQDRTGEKVTGGVTGTERMRKAEANRCNACYFNVAAYANEIRA